MYILMGNHVLTMKFLQYTQDLDVDPTLDVQITTKLYDLFEELDLGYVDGLQEAQLSLNAKHMKDTLCFVQKYWSALVRAEFPSIPNNGVDNYHMSKLLELLTTTQTKKKNEEKISSTKIVSHINTLSDLQWGEFSAAAFKPAVNCIKDEIKAIIQLLQRHKNKLCNDASKKFQKLLNKGADPSPDKRTVVSVFKNSLKLVQLCDSEFHTELDPQKNPGKKRPGRPGQFAICVNSAVDALYSRLRGLGDYEPIALTDEEMAIDKFADAIGEHCLTPNQRARYRENFRSELALGAKGMVIHVFGILDDSRHPDCIFVWKVPAVAPPNHAGSVAKAMTACREMAPKHMGQEAVRHFNSIIDRVTGMPVRVRDALRNYLFRGDPNPDNSIADDYVQFVLDMAAGLPVTEAVLSDRRVNNSRGGKGIGATNYDAFWQACREVILPASAAEERRHSNTVHASGAHSIPNLMKLATDILQRRVDSGELVRLPPIPSEEWVRLQFVPNVSDNAAAAKFTGQLQAKRAVQTRTLRKEHMDQHFVNAFTRYHLEWLVELRLKYPGVEFFGQDDKAKIPCGHSVPVSSGVRPNNKSIVAVGDERRLQALDHDFHVENITSSVTLRCNIPEEVSGSFFIGEGDDGMGQIFVTIRDAIFDPSEVFDHCAQLIDTIRRRRLNPTVLVLQTDGGPDHSPLNRWATKFALFAMFKELNVDHLVVLRCAPNGSARNKVERAMSVLNLPLAHVALSRKDMPEWAEAAVNNCCSMAAIRDAAKKVDERRLAAVKYIRELHLARVVRPFISQGLDGALEVDGLSDAAASLARDRAKTAAKEATSLVFSFLGIKTALHESDVAGAVVTGNGVSIVRDSTLAGSVAQSQRDKAVKEASRNLYREWKEAMQEPIDFLSERFGNLKTGNQDVVVTPRVPRKAVETLHGHLAAIAPKYTSSVMRKEHLKEVPELVDHLDAHVVKTPYSFSAQKCSNVACCGVIRTPVDVRELAMQRQPTPRLDPRRKNLHFLRRSDALAGAANNPKALTDLTDLPSAAGDAKKEEARKRANRDTQVAKDLGLKSWDSKRVRSFVKCYHCGKRRCIYSGTETDYSAASLVLQQKLESVSLRFSCGDLLFDDDHYLSKVLVQKQNLSCETQIEKGYYNNKDRALKLKPICIHCGEEGSGSFLLDLNEMRRRCMTDGYNCFPICVDCIGNGKKPVKGGKKDATQARTERIEKAKKSKK